jgi:hypothetical protein
MLSFLLVLLSIFAALVLFSAAAAALCPSYVKE